MIRNLLRFNLDAHRLNLISLKKKTKSSTLQETHNFFHRYKSVKFKYKDIEPREIFRTNTYFNLIRTFRK